MEQGSAPRDLLRRRVRVAEYYFVPSCYTGGWRRANSAFDPTVNTTADTNSSEMPTVGGTRGVGLFEGAVDPSGFTNPATGATAADGSIVIRDKDDAQGELQLYDESSDSWASIPYSTLLEQGRKFGTYANQFLPRRPNGDPLKQPVEADFGSVLVLRPNIGNPLNMVFLSHWPQTNVFFQLSRALDDGRVRREGGHRLSRKYSYIPSDFSVTNPNSMTGGHSLGPD